MHVRDDSLPDSYDVLLADARDFPRASLGAPARVIDLRDRVPGPRGAVDATVRISDACAGMVDESAMGFSAV